MQKLLAFGLALALSLLAFAALASATAEFPCDFVHAARPKVPGCAPAPAPLVSSIGHGVIGT